MTARPALPRRLRLAVVGAGYFSRFHYDAWRRIPEVEVVAVCDRDRVKAREAAKPFTGAQVHDDVSRMLDETQPDLLDIVTPPESHAAPIEAACARGIAMICQKPLAPTHAEAENLAARAETAGVMLVVHENFRFAPWFREAQRLLSSGALGDPLGITFRLRPGDGRGPNAYLDRQPYFQRMPRLLIHETAIHLIDSFRFVMGEVVGVFARLRRINPVIAGEDAGIVVFDFENRAAGLFDGNRHVDHPATDVRLTMGTMILEGSSAALRLDGEGRLWLKAHGREETEHEYIWSRRGFAGDAVFALQQHVVAHMLRGTGLENNARAYLRNIAIEEAIYRSHAEARWIATDIAPGERR